MESKNNFRRLEVLWEHLDFTPDFSEIRGLASQLQNVVPKAQLYNAVLHSVFSRFFMCDYWASVAVLEVNEFVKCLPRTAVHATAKKDADELGDLFVTFAENYKSIDDVVKNLTSHFARFIQSGKDPVQTVLRLSPALHAAYTMSQLDFQKFLTFEYGCWLLKNLAFQRMCVFRAQTEPVLAWENEEVLQLSKMVDLRLIPKIKDLKKVLGWNEIVLSYK